MPEHWGAEARKIMPGLYDLVAGPKVREITPHEAAVEMNVPRPPAAYYDTKTDIISLVPGMFEVEGGSKEPILKGLLEHELRHSLKKRWKEILPEKVLKDIMRTVPLDIYTQRLAMPGDMSLSDLIEERFAAEPMGYRWRPAPIESEEYIKGLIPLMLYGAYEPPAPGE